MVSSFANTHMVKVTSEPDTKNAQWLRHLRSLDDRSGEGGVQLLKILKEVEDGAYAVLGEAAAAVSVRLATAKNAVTVPAEAAAVLVERLRTIGIEAASRFPPEARDAASSILAALLDLCRLRSEDAALVRVELERKDRLVGKGSLSAIFSIMYHGEHGGDAGGAAFVHACHLLAFLTSGDEELAKVLIGAGGIELLAGRLLRATPPRDCRPDDVPADFGTEWLPFATAATVLLDEVTAVPDSDGARLADSRLHVSPWAHGSRSQTVVDACVAALDRSLLREQGHMVLQPLHLTGLRVLCRCGRFSKEAASRVVASGGLEIGVKALEVGSQNEEAVLVALTFLADLAQAREFSSARVRRVNAAFRLAPSGCKEMVEKVRARYARSADVQTEAARLLRSLDGSDDGCWPERAKNGPCPPTSVNAVRAARRPF